MNYSPDTVAISSSVWLTLGSATAWIRAPIGAAIAALPRNEMLKRGPLLAGRPKPRGAISTGSIAFWPGAEIDGLFHDGLLDGDAGRALVMLKDLLPLSECGRMS